MSFVELTYTIKQILENNERISEVYDYETMKFRGYPAVVITPGENESDYETTTENKRTYVFSVKIFVERKKRSPQDTEKHLRMLMDAVLDDLEKDDNWTLASANMPSGYTLLVMHPSPSIWGYVEIGEVTLRFAEIRVAVQVSIDCKTIS